MKEIKGLLNEANKVNYFLPYFLSVYIRSLYLRLESVKSSGMSKDNKILLKVPTSFYFGKETYPH